MLQAFNFSFFSRVPVQNCQEPSTRRQCTKSVEIFFNVLREYFLEMLDVSGPSFGCPKRTILYAGPGTDVPRFSE
jgi:hypothetical protein